MKRIYIFCIISVFVSLMLSSCSGDMFDNIKEYASEEKVFVGKFDKADGRVGLNRAEIDLMDAGRIPSDQVKIGKAVKTIVEYDGKKIAYDVVPSWLNLTGLTEPKLYRIKIYNEDEFGNRSLPVEVAVIPFTDIDLASLVVPAPERVLAPLAAELSWPNGLTTSFYDYEALQVTYTDADGVKQVINTTDTRVALPNLTPGSVNTADLRLKIVPKQDGVPILDTVYIDSSISLQLPSVEQYLASRTARSVRLPLIENGINNLIWNAATEHLAFSEVRYQTASSETRIVRAWASDVMVECPDIATGSHFEIRSSFVPPASVDTFTLDWTPYSYPFYSFSVTPGVYTVNPTSWRGGNEETLDTPPPATLQEEYSHNNKVTISNPEPGVYRVSDMFGGYYVLGRGYVGYPNGEMDPYGDFIPSFGPWTLQYVQLDYWGYGVRWVGGRYDAATNTLYLISYWSGYTWHLILEKE
jgi:hypothetical protein